MHDAARKLPYSHRLMFADLLRGSGPISSVFRDSLPLEENP